MAETKDTAAVPAPPAKTGPRLIVEVVNRGTADPAVRAAMRAGAQGATVFIGHIAQKEQHVGAAGLAVKVEKEIIVTVVGANIVDQVMQAMVAAGVPYEHDEGYIANLPVHRVVGLLEMRKAREEG